MLTGVQLAIVGGDARQLQVIQKLEELDASITLIGFDKLDHKYPNIQNGEMRVELCKKLDAIVLPVIGTDDLGQVSSNFTEKPVLIKDEHISSLPKHAKIYTGLANIYLKNIAHHHQIEIVELLERNDIAIYNSIPTAEGAIMLAIQHTEITLHRSKCIVLGMGRIGTTLARILQSLGAYVKIGLNTEDQFARAWEMNLEPFYLDDLSFEVNKIDLIFNTIPSMIITAQIIVKIPQHAVIIDLASSPGGTDYRFAAKRGIKAMLAPGLPGLVAPITAGKIIANTLGHLIQEDISKRGSES